MKIKAGALDPKLENTVHRGYRIVKATDMETANHAISFAIVRGSVGCTESEMEVAGPEVMSDDREAVRYAEVTRDVPLKVGQTVYASNFYFEKDQKTVKKCEVIKLTVVRIIPNYLGKYGLRYGASRPSDKKSICTPYRPERLYTERGDAVTHLRRRIQERIDILTEALSKVS